jgi:hypothetical protein
MPHLPLDICKDLAAIGLIPAPVQLLGGHTELGHEIGREIFWLDLPPLLSPKPGRSAAPIRGGARHPSDWWPRDLEDPRAGRVVGSGGYR